MVFGFVPPKKNHQTMLRLDGEQHRLLMEAAEASHIQAAILARAAVVAMLDAYRTRGRIEFPLRLEDPGAAYMASPAKPPDKTSRSRGAGPDHRVSKSA